MQACPYDALYIDPDSHTAAKCNYCAHRLDGGYEPACVIVCPVEAIISGDMDDENSKISGLLVNENVMARKPEKMTQPNLYYINGTNEMLDPNQTKADWEYVWSEQSKGVGHYAKYADKRVNESDTENLLIQLAMENSARSGKPIDQRSIDRVAKEIQQDLDESKARRVYDSPSKGVLWGWEVTSYVWTKAIATGTFLMMAIYQFINGTLDHTVELSGLYTSLIFMGLTGALLVKDLDRPDRFLYVLLRPQWRSWLVKGAYIITAFGGMVTLLLVDHYFGFGLKWAWAIGSIFAVLGAIYTAFLFDQARGRDLWQSPWIGALHMLVHAIIAGSAFMIMIDTGSISIMRSILYLSILLNVFIILKEILIPHKTPDSKKAIQMMTNGYYSKYFWTGLIIGSLLPFLILTGSTGYELVAGILALVGIFLTEFVRIRVPQMIPLS
tara:strand:- start:1667 stop:2989 length:1323 start_codon:yes stop_codon:yes gene_type:complete